MKATFLAMTLCATAIAHADAKNDDASTINAAQVEKTATVRAQMEAARAQMEVARAQMDDARAELQAAARQWAAAARTTKLETKNRAFLGVLIGEQSEDGIVVAGVSPAGGAETAGIQAEDIIVAINGESLTSHDRPLDILHRVLDDVSPGGEVKLTVSRDGDIETYDVGTGPAFVQFEGGPEQLRRLAKAFAGPLAPVFTPAAPLAPTRDWLDLVRSPDRTVGLHLVDIGEDLGDYFGVDAGVLVLNAPGKSELIPGDIVRRIDGADVGSSEEAHRLLAGSSDEDADVEIRRKKRKVELTVAKVPPPTVQMMYSMPSNEPGKEHVIVTGSVQLKTEPEVEVEVEVEADDGS